MTTTLLAFEYRAAYRPRINGPRSSRRYSARISSPSNLPFFINSPFQSGCETSADNAYRATSVWLGDGKHAT